MSAIRTIRTVNSVYEVNDDDKLIRRTVGVNDPTPYQGPHNEWRSFVSVMMEGDGLFIRWSDTRATWTSPVIA